MPGLLLSPDEAYRKVELDARIEGSDGEGLAKICLEAVIQSLDRACIAHSRGKAIMRNEALTRANMIILGMERALDPANPLSGAIREFYGGAKFTIAGAISDFDGPAISRLRDDFDEILSALFEKR